MITEQEGLKEDTEFTVHIVLSRRSIFYLNGEWTHNSSEILNETIISVGGNKLMAEVEYQKLLNKLNGV